MKFHVIAFVSTCLNSAAPAREPTNPAQEQRPYLERLFNPSGRQSTKRPSGNAKVSNVEPWQLFPIGSLPPGKVLNAAATADLKEGDYSGETIYLVGTFVSGAIHEPNVTFTYAKPGTKRGDALPKWATTRIRIIVEYCPGVDLPMGGSKITLDQSRGFLLRTVKRTSTFDNLDTLVLSARHIVQPEIAALE